MVRRKPNRYKRELKLMTMEERKKVFIDSRLEKDHYWITCIGVGGLVAIFGLLYMMICLNGDARIEHWASFFGLTSISIFIFALAEIRRIKYSSEYEAKQDRIELRRKQRLNRIG